MRFVSLGKILLLFVVSFTFKGCPAGHYHKYTYVGDEEVDNSQWFTKLTLNGHLQLEVSCGYYIDFTRNRHTGISFSVSTDETVEISASALVKSVHSSTFGPMTQYPVERFEDFPVDTIHTASFEHRFQERKQRNERRMLKQIENDTVTVTLVDGQELVFVRK